jgi:hypothetical protein
MLCTNTSISFSHFLKNLLIMPLHVFVLGNDVNVDVTIADMTVSKNQLTGFSQMVGQQGPFLNIKTDVIS